MKSLTETIATMPEANAGLIGNGADHMPTVDEVAA